MATTLIDFSPALFYLQAALQEITVTGLNLQPSLIYVSPNGGYWNPVGVQVAPTLASIQAAGATTIPANTHRKPGLKVCLRKCQMN